MQIVIDIPEDVKEVFNKAKELVLSTETRFRRGGTRERKIVRGGPNTCEGKIYYDNNGSILVFC